MHPGKVNLGIEPLLYGSCPDYRPGLLPHVDAPYSDWHQSSAIQNRAHQPEFPAVFPDSPCHAICGTADTRYPISRRTAVNPATVLLCVKSLLLFILHGNTSFRISCSHYTISTKHAIDKSPVIPGLFPSLPTYLVLPSIFVLADAFFQAWAPITASLMSWRCCFILQKCATGTPSFLWNVQNKSSLAPKCSILIHRRTMQNSINIVKLEGNCFFVAWRKMAERLFPLSRTSNEII